MQLWPKIVRSLSVCRGGLYVTIATCPGYSSTVVATAAAAAAAATVTY
jgi:hypothetical protein